MYAFVGLLRLLASIIRLIVVFRQRTEPNAGARACRNPQLAHEYSRRGHAKREQGDFDGAIDDFSLAIAVDPNDVDHYFFRGVARHFKGDLDAAIVDFDRAIALDPNDAACYYFRGDTEYERGI